MSRGNLFAKLERAERIVEHALEPPPRPRIVPPSPSARSAQPLPEPAAIRTARMRRPRPPVTIAIPPRSPRPGDAAMLSAKSLKATLVLDPAAVAAIDLPDGAAAPPLLIEVGGRKVKVQVSAKSLRKVLAQIRQHGPGGVAIVVQGKLQMDEVLAEAGFAVTVKKAVPVTEARRIGG